MNTDAIRRRLEAIEQRLDQSPMVVTHAVAMQRLAAIAAVCLAVNVQASTAKWRLQQSDWDVAGAIESIKESVARRDATDVQP